MGAHRTTSFRCTLLAAAVLHGALLWWMRAHSWQDSTDVHVADGAHSDDNPIEIEPESTDSSAAGAPTSGQEAAEPVAVVVAPRRSGGERFDRTTETQKDAPAGAHREERRTESQESEGPAEKDGDEPAQGGPGAGAGSGSKPIDLGIGPGAWTRWMAAASATPEQPKLRTERRTAVVSTTGGLREALEAHDQEIGLGPSGAILSAARAGAHSEVAPQLGRATFVAVVLRDGQVTVTLESCDANTAGWQKVARAMRDELSRRPPNIDPGRKGVEITVEISAEERWPNGSKTTSEGPHVSLELSEVAATDEARDAILKRNPAAVVQPAPDPALPSLKIMPKPPGLFVKGRGKVCSYAIGVTPFGFALSAPCDPSNIGASPIRVVATRVVRQSPI